MLNLNDSGLYHPINCQGSVVGHKADDEDDQIDQEETEYSAVAGSSSGCSGRAPERSRLSSMSQS